MLDRFATVILDRVRPPSRRRTAPASKSDRSDSRIGQSGRVPERERSKRNALGRSRACRRWLSVEPRLLLDAIEPHRPRHESCARHGRCVTTPSKLHDLTRFQHGQATLAHSRPSPLHARPLSDPTLDPQRSRCRRLLR